MPSIEYTGCPFLKSTTPVNRLWGNVPGLFRLLPTGFPPVTFLEGRRKPMSGLQRHPLIYPIFPAFAG